MYATGTEPTIETTNELIGHKDHMVKVKRRCVDYLKQKKTPRLGHPLCTPLEVDGCVDKNFRCLFMYKTKQLKDTHEP